VGIELYSVRDELAKDMPGTLRTVARQGYEVVEFFSPYFDWTPQIAMEARKVMDDAGIKCNSTHNNMPSFTMEGLKKAIELNQIIGSRNIIMAQGPRITTLDGWKALGEQLTMVSDQLKHWEWEPGITIMRRNGHCWKGSGPWMSWPRAVQRM
jgi:sugar phosphate isomerase/epimerase